MATTTVNQQNGLLSKGADERKENDVEQKESFTDSLMAQLPEDTRENERPHHDFLKGASSKEKEEASSELLDILTGTIDCEPPFDRRIFVNRTLRIDNIAWIGFDMDYTLIRYNSPQLENFIYDHALQKLLDAGFPEELKAFHFDPERIVRGTIIDKELGNIFKMNRHRHVEIAYRGHRRLTKNERKIYRDNRFSFTDSDRFYLIDTVFSIPEACLFCDVIDWFEKHREGEDPLNYRQLFDAVRDAVDRVHSEGILSRHVIEDPSYFIKKDGEMVHTLERFRMSGKKLFLLTNSDWDYTDKVMAYLFEQEGENVSWRDYFDLVIVKARKPNFFTKNEPFRYLDHRGDEMGQGDEIGEYRFLRGGNFKSLYHFLGAADRVLYVGDHIYGDILRTKKSTPWRTMWIVEELEQEILHLRELQESIQKWENLQKKRASLDSELHFQCMLLEQLKQLESKTDKKISVRMPLQERARLRSIAKTERTADRLRRELEEILQKSHQLGEEISNHFNPYWGMLFREGLQYSYLGEQVRTFACIYSSRVSNFLFYTPSQYFLPPRPLLPHEQIG